MISTFFVPSPRSSRHRQRRARLSRPHHQTVLALALEWLPMAFTLWIDPGCVAVRMGSGPGASRSCDFDLIKSVLLRPPSTSSGVRWWLLPLSVTSPAHRQQRTSTIPSSSPRLPSHSPATPSPSPTHRATRAPPPPPPPPPAAAVSFAVSASRARIPSPPTLQALAVSKPMPKSRALASVRRSPRSLRARLARTTNTMLRLRHYERFAVFAC